MNTEDFALWRFSEIYESILETWLEAEMRILGTSLLKSFLTHGKKILKILSPAKKSSEWILVSAGVSKGKN